MAISNCFFLLTSENAGGIFSLVGICKVMFLRT